MSTRVKRLGLTPRLQIIRHSPGGERLGSSWRGDGAPSLHLTRPITVTNGVKRARGKMADRYLSSPDMVLTPVMLVGPPRLSMDGVKALQLGSPSARVWDGYRRWTGNWQHEQRRNPPRLPGFRVGRLMANADPV